MEPGQADHHWGRSHARLLELGAAFASADLGRGRDRGCMYGSCRSTGQVAGSGRENARGANGAASQGTYHQKPWIKQAAPRSSIPSKQGGTLGPVGQCG